MPNYIRFDWAMKRMLRDKANHAVLEGLLTSLIGERFRIERFLESESNRRDEDDKFNRVDILAENDRGELVIIEIQNSHELAYFHRMLYGVSKAITDYIALGSDYSKVKKVYSVNIVYFSLGQGNDYVYHGKTIFRGLHDKDDVLMLSRRQQEVFFGSTCNPSGKSREAGDIFPEYYVLKVNNFDQVARTPLDEWIEFLKTGEIDANASAPGLSEARTCLDYDRLPIDERRAYVRHMENLSYQSSVLGTSFDDGEQKGIIIGRHEEKREIARNLLALNTPISTIASATGLSEEEIKMLK